MALKVLKRAKAMIQWKKGSNHHIVSDCGNYKVCQTGRNDYTKFTAWKKVSPICDATLGVFMIPQEAKQACEDDKIKQEQSQ